MPDLPQVISQNSLLLIVQELSLLLIKSKNLVIIVFTGYFQGCMMNFHAVRIVSKIRNVTNCELSLGECQGASIAANVG